VVAAAAAAAVAATTITCSHFCSRKNQTIT
jgi:hypothetical protein